MCLRSHSASGPPIPKPRCWLKSSETAFHPSACDPLPYSRWAVPIQRDFPTCGSFSYLAFSRVTICPSLRIRPSWATLASRACRRSLEVWRSCRGQTLRTAADLLFEVVSRAYKRLTLIITTNLSFESWVEIFGCERLTGAPLDRLTHRVHIIEANGPSYRLRQSKRRLQKGQPKSDEDPSPEPKPSASGDV